MPRRQLVGRRVIMATENTLVLSGPKAEPQPLQVRFTNVSREQRRCRNCHHWFDPKNIKQVCCSRKCQIESYDKKKRTKTYYKKRYAKRKSKQKAINKRLKAVGMGHLKVVVRG